jgi:hypothetical protein
MRELYFKCCPELALCPDEDSGKKRLSRAYIYAELCEKGH